MKYRGEEHEGIGEELGIEATCLSLGMSSALLVAFSGFDQTRRQYKGFFIRRSEYFFSNRPVSSTGLYRPVTGTIPTDFSVGTSTYHVQGDP